MLRNVSRNLCGSGWVQSILIDTGPLVALFSRRDKHHARMVKFLADFEGVLLTTWPVVTEVCHLISRENRNRFMRWAAGGGIVVRDLGENAAIQALALMEKYGDLPMDVADASLLILSEQAGLTDIATLDIADFSVYRLSGGRSFNLLPA